MRGSWISISYLAVWGYVLYGIGSATPYLRADLHLTDFEAGLHASALAVGILASGFIADAVARVVRPGRLSDIAFVSIVAGLIFVALAPFLALSLAGAFLIGLGGGTLLTHVNVHLVRSGGDDSRRLIGQANAVTMITAASAPLAIGLAASGLHAWRVALFLPIMGLLVLTALRPRDSSRGRPVRVPRAKLPTPYWFVWLLLALGVAIEFSFVVWGSTVVGRRPGVSDADATLLAGLFVTGMFVGRGAVRPWPCIGRGRRGVGLVDHPCPRRGRAGSRGGYAEAARTAAGGARAPAELNRPGQSRVDPGETPARVRAARQDKGDTAPGVGSSGPEGGLSGLVSSSGPLRNPPSDCATRPDRFLSLPARPSHWRDGNARPARQDTW